MPELVGGVDDCGALGDARVVDENIRVAKTFAQIAEHACDAFRIGDVTDERDRIVADFPRDLFDLFGSSRGNGDADSLACEGEGDSATDASAAASDQRDLVFEHVSGR